MKMTFKSMVAPQKNLFSLASIFDWLRPEQAAQSLVSSIFSGATGRKLDSLRGVFLLAAPGWWTDLIGATLGQSAPAGAVKPVFPPVLNCSQNRF